MRRGFLAKAPNPRLTRSPIILASWKSKYILAMFRSKYRWAMDEDKATGRARGGIARAAALSPERRREIARHAIEARWSKNLPTAVYGSPDRPVRVGNVELQCYVLDDDDET